MRYDDDIYSNEEDNDLWDDELELTSDDSLPSLSETPRTSYASESTYTPYHAEDDDHGDDASNSDGKHVTPYEHEDHDYYSDSEQEPQEPSKPLRRRLFGKKDKEEDEEEDDGNDYYDTDDEPAPKAQKPKAPKLDPEDPDYWIEEEEPTLSGILTPPGKKWKWKLPTAIAILVLIVFGWIWFFRPYTDSAVKYGYIKNMERRGSLIKTFEGTLIPYKELGDPNPFYFEEVGFSVESDSLAALMKRMMLGCVPVRIEYELYHAPLPWKGEEKMIVIKADTADPRKILPPEYRHKL